MAANSQPHFQKRPDARPGELLAAALEVFAANGYHATRLEEVAARAGVSRGTIYLYFQTKEDLLLQAVNHFLQLASEDAPRPDELQGRTCRERLEGVLRTMWLTAHEPNWARVYRLVLGEGTSEHPAVFRAFAENGMIPVWELLATVVEEGQESGEFRQDVSAREVVRVLVTGLVQQAYFEIHTVAGELAPADLQRMIGSSLRVFLDGMQAR